MNATPDALEDGKRRTPPWKMAVLAAVLCLAALVAVNSPILYVYTPRIYGGLAPVVMPYEALAGGMDEQSALRLFKGGGFKCVEQSGTLGERACYNTPSTVDGVTALTIALFFRQGRLEHAVVHVPWWAHHAMARRLVQRLGPPAKYQDGEKAGSRLMEWPVGAGAVWINRDPGWNPLAWSAVYWNPAARPSVPK